MFRAKVGIFLLEPKQEKRIGAQHSKCWGSAFRTWEVEKSFWSSQVQRGFPFSACSHSKATWIPFHILRHPAVIWKYERFGLTLHIQARSGKIYAGNCTKKYALFFFADLLHSHMICRIHLIKALIKFELGTILTFLTKMSQAYPETSATYRR